MNPKQFIVSFFFSRVETDDITIWAVKNESTSDDEMTTIAAPVETTAEAMAETTPSAATTAQVNKQTTIATERMGTKEESTSENKDIIT